MADNFTKNLTIFEIPTFVTAEPQYLDRFKHEELLKLPLTELVAKHFVDQSRVFGLSNGKLLLVLLRTVDKLDKYALVLIKRIWRHSQIHGLPTEVLNLSLLVRHLLDVTSVEFEKVRE